MNEQTLFTAALERTPDDRSAFLKQACGSNLKLRERLSKLMRLHESAGDFLEWPAAGRRDDGNDCLIEKPGAVIGPYKLLQQIGEGGMGVVFMAEQATPVQRKVAFKIIKPGMDSRQVVARFEAERQALALMEHPNIALVLDAGATDSGRPYFVMELVKGVPITEYCDTMLLAPRERLELFLPVCQAVQHAHQKGIIHRDLKPTNVLIALYDGKPVPKVIDFGVAKATGSKLTEQTLFTEFGQVVGTIEYMSPEQAGLNQLDVDTRSDIYSLGVLLYELLTGTTPLERKRLKDAALLELLRLVREEEPPKPSTRLSATSALPLIAASRGLEAKRLNGLVKGELDWMVMKCLEKQRDRRYETAGAFAADIQHYLKDEAIQACPPSTWYRTRKLIWRNKGPFLAASAVMLLLFTTLIILAVTNSWIRQEQALTKQEKVRSEKAQQLAELRANENRRGLERLQAATALQQRGRVYFDLQQWDHTYAAFSKAVELRPDLAAAWGERADLAATLGLWDLASDDFVREFKLIEPDATARWFRHALLRLQLEDVDGYRRICRQMRERFDGTSNQLFAAEMVRTCALAAEPADDLHALVKLARLGVRAAPRSWYRLYVLGLAEYRAGAYEQAAQQLSDSLAAEPEFADRAVSYPVLAMAQYRLGRTAEARAALESADKAIDRWTQQLYEGPSHLPWVFHQGATAQWPITWWDWLECRHYYREAKLLVDGSAPTEDVRLHVLRARAFARLRQRSRADAEYATAVLVRPSDSQIRLEAHRSAAFGALERGQFADAAAQFTGATRLTPDDADLWRFRAVAYLGAGNVEQYRGTCHTMLERFEKTTEFRGAGNVLLVSVLRQDALADMSRLLPLCEIAAGWHHLGGYVRGAALYRAGKYQASIECFEEEAKSFQPRAWEWSFLAMAHHQAGHAAKAQRCLREAAQWIDAANARTDDDLRRTQPAWGDSLEPVMFPLLLREAEKLVNKRESARAM